MGPIIDLSTMFPWRIMQLFATAFAFYNISRSLLKDKFSPLATFGAVFAARIVTSLLFYNADTTVNKLGYVVYCILLFFIALFMMTGSVYKKVISMLFWLISNLGCMFGIAALYSIVYNTTFEKIITHDYTDYMSTYMISCIIFIASSFLFAGILKAADSKKAKDRSKKVFAYITFLPFSHIVVVSIAMFTAPGAYSGSDAKDRIANIVVYIILLLVMLFDCSFPFVIEYFEKIHRQNIIGEREILRNKMDYNQILMLNEEKQRYRRIKHDFANITATAAGFIEMGKPEKALHILNKTSDDISQISEFSVCSNDAINTTLYLKKQEAKKIGVKLDIEIDESFPIQADDYDICRILFNIADNSVTAASKLNNNKTSFIRVEINKDEIVFESRNGKPRGHENRLQSKADEHGYGTKIIKEIAAKYGGTYTHKTEGNNYCTKTVLKNISVKVE